MKPAQPSKIEDHSVETTSTEAACAPTIVYCGCEHNDRFHVGSLVRALFQALLGDRPKEGKGQGTARATLQDFRQNTSFASKEYPDMGTVRLHCVQDCFAQSSVSKFSYCVPMCVCIL